MTLRKKIESITIKVLLVMVAASFVIWGVNGGSGVKRENWVIKVGDKGVSYGEWNKLLQISINKIKQNNPQLFDNRGLQKDSQLLNSIKRELLREKIDDMILIQEAHRLGISISDEQVKREIHKINIFWNKKGQFSKTKFKKVMRNNGITEWAFVEKLRDNMAKFYVIGIFFPQKPIIAPQLQDAIIRAYYAKRTVEVYQISPLTVTVTLPPPSEVDLKQLIHDNSSTFSTPEMRSYTYFVLTPDSLQKDKISVSEDEIQAIYDSKKSFYVDQETRNFIRITLKTEADAKKMLDAFIEYQKSQKSNRGKINRDHAVTENSLSIIAQNVTITPLSITSLKSVTRRSIDNTVADVVFSLSEKTMSRPIQTRDGWHICYVQGINPKKTKELSEIRGDLKNQIFNEKLFDKLNNVAKEIEHELNTQNSYDHFLDVAKKHNLSVQYVRNATQTVATDVLLGAKVNHKKRGNRDDQKVGQHMNVINTLAFSTEKDEISPVTPIGESFGVVYVTDIQHSKIPDFTTIHEKAAEMWRNIQQDITLSQIAYAKLASISQDVTHTSTSKNTPSSPGSNNFAQYNKNGLHTVKNTEIKRPVIHTQQVTKDGDELQSVLSPIAPVTVVLQKNVPPSLQSIPGSMYNELVGSKEREFSSVHHCNGQVRNCYIFGRTVSIQYLAQDEIQNLREKLEPQVISMYQDMSMEEYMRALKAHYKIDIRYDILQLTPDRQ